MANLFEMGPFERAMDNIVNALGGETDPDVLFYNTLEERDFQNMVRRYGFEDVRRYIQTIETKKLGLRRIFR